MKRLYFHIFTLLALLPTLPVFVLSTGCSSQQVAKDSPDALFADAEEDYKDERYLSAIDKFRDIKNRFPYSNRAIDAELRIADTYFAQESYIEAESAYEVFKELHPLHPKADYVQFQIGQSNYNQIPDVATRDLVAAHKAIDSFNVLVEKYPSSEYVAKANELSAEARKRLAEYERYVADFYYLKKHYLSASYRYAALLNEFGNMGYDEEALYRLGHSYMNIRMFGNAQDALKRLLNKYPQSSYRAEAEALLQELPKKN